PLPSQRHPLLTEGARAGLDKAPTADNESVPWYWHTKRFRHAAAAIRETTNHLGEGIKMKITTYLSAAALVLALIVIGPASQARARNFSNSSLFGTFTSLVVSTNIAPNGVSRYVFDGQGNYPRTLILMGTPPGPCTFTETGTYSVNPDGT